MEQTYPVKQAFQKTSYQRGPEVQRSIARSVAINNVFSNLNLENKLMIVANDNTRAGLFELATTIENWLVR